ncbi:hypothetical protein GGR56DRAFT_678459 [Xylariaceae sp. FL0804]|nr:hypothetical protein GGR56DRAFT_678459 [Xylariaceae sp. FL0804]
MPLRSNIAIASSPEQLPLPEDAPAGDKLFLVFISSDDELTGQPWCPDVRAALPNLERTFDAGGNKLSLGVVPVGQKAEWRDPANVFRTVWNVNCIPTLVRYERVAGKVAETGRLSEGELLDGERLSAFVT